MRREIGSSLYLCTSACRQPRDSLRGYLKPTSIPGRSILQACLLCVCGQNGQMCKRHFPVFTQVPAGDHGQDWAKQLLPASSSVPSILHACLVCVSDSMVLRGIGVSLCLRKCLLPTMVMALGGLAGLNISACPSIPQACTLSVSRHPATSISHFNRGASHCLCDKCLQRPTVRPITRGRTIGETNNMHLHKLKSNGVKNGATIGSC